MILYCLQLVILSHSGLEFVQYSYFVRMLFYFLAMTSFSYSSDTSTESSPSYDKLVLNDGDEDGVNESYSKLSEAR